MMICGGVNCLLEPNLFVALCKANMLARDGQCKAFTDDADGYGRGEGCGIVILKRLKDVRYYSIIFNSHNCMHDHSF